MVRYIDTYVLLTKALKKVGDIPTLAPPIHPTPDCPGESRSPVQKVSMCQLADWHIVSDQSTAYLQEVPWG